MSSENATPRDDDINQAIGDLNLDTEDELLRKCEELDGTMKAGGYKKESYNYLLFKPQNILDFQRKKGEMTYAQQMRAFENAIFYVGRGTESRPADPLKEAQDTTSGRVTNKIKRIKECLKDPGYFFALEIFKKSFSHEAETRKAVIISYIGIGRNRLDNGREGSISSTVVSEWTPNTKRLYGKSLVAHAMRGYLDNPETMYRLPSQELEQAEHSS